MSADEFDRLLSQFKLAEALELPDELKISLLGKAGSILMLGYNSHSSYVHLEQAFHFVGAALMVANERTESTPRLTYNSAVLLSSRHSLSRNIADLEFAIAIFRDLTSGISIIVVDQIVVAGWAATALVRGMMSWRHQDLEESVNCRRLSSDLQKRANQNWTFE